LAGQGLIGESDAGAVLEFIPVPGYNRFHVWIKQAMPSCAGIPSQGTQQEGNGLNRFTAEQEANTLDLREVLRIIRRRLWILMLACVLAGATGYIMTVFAITPVYQASAMLIVNKADSAGASQGSQPVTYNDILMTQKLVKTYSIILQSDTVLSQVIGSLGLDTSTAALKKQINISGVNETEVLKITVTSPDPVEAAVIANEIVEKAPEEIIRTAKVGSVETVDSARIPAKPYKPSLPRNMAVAAFLGLAAAAGVIFLVEYLDNTIKSDEDIRQHYGLPVLGILPVQRHDWRSYEKRMAR
jgi:capsular polysaccharide biosynthesis protein